MRDFMYSAAVWTILYVILVSTSATADYCVVRSWDDRNRPDNIGRADTPEEAQAKVDRLIGLGYEGAFYFDDTAWSDGGECWGVDPIHWVVDPIAKTASLNAVSVTTEWRDKRKDQAQVEAVRRKKPLTRVESVAQEIAASNKVVGVQGALYTLYKEINTMTLSDLKALDVSTWVGWP